MIEEKLITGVTEEMEDGCTRGHSDGTKEATYDSKDHTDLKYHILAIIKPTSFIVKTA